MSSIRSIGLIRIDLETAREYQRRAATRPSTDPLVTEMRMANEAEISHLEKELREAMSGVLEVALDGIQIENHRIEVPYFSRVLESIQSTYRAVFRSLSQEMHLHRGEATLALVATGPGSFSVTLAAPPAQLELLDEPRGDRALAEIVSLLEAAANGDAQSAGREWSATRDEASVRAMIRLAASLASSRGSTRVRMTQSSGVEHVTTVSARSARDLAAALAGEPGREILTVTGHLEMAQDRPPRVRVQTEDDVFVADIPPGLLETVKSLLFETVQATLIVDVRTSATTGSPGIVTELMDIEPA